MRITGMNLSGPQHGPAKTNPFQHPASKPAALQQKGAMGLRLMQDTVSISPGGKASSAISGLEKLKQQIEDRRSEYLSKAAEKGQSAEVIKAQMESFDQQLKDIDKQITQMSIQQTNQQMEKAKHTTSSLNRRPKTRQEVENQRLADITSLSTGLDKAGAMQSAKTKVDGQIGIKETELELERSRNGDTTQLEARLAELQNQSNQLMSGLQDQLTETLEDIKESNDKVTDTEIVEPDKPEDGDHKDDNKVEDKKPIPQEGQTDAPQQSDNQEDTPVQGDADT